MAGDWIKMRNNLWDDPRVSRLCDLTGSKEACVIGGLYWLWAMADEHTEDGHLPGLTLAGIDRKTGLQGFGAALIEIGWLSEGLGGVTLQRFEEHNGSSAKRRCMDASRKAASRSASASDADTTRTDDGQDAPNCGAREEKRREEGKATADAVAGARPPAEPAPLALVDARKRPKTSIPDCPHQEILALWTEVLPHLPQHLPDHWRGARADHLRARWRETAAAKRWPDAEAGLTFFRRLFVHVGRSAFLTGRTKPSDPSRPPFVAELAWLVMPDNWAKVIEGRYHPEAAEA